MIRSKRISHNGNGKIPAENAWPGAAAAAKEPTDGNLRKLLQRAVNREKAPEGLKELIGRKIRQ